LLLRVRPDDAAAVRSAVDEAREAFGALNGVVHAQWLGPAAAPADLAEASPGDVGAELARVARDLAALGAALDGIPLDYAILQNSNFSVFGGPRLAAATAAGVLADAWAACSGGRWTSLDWDRWHLDEEEGSPRTAYNEGAILRGEGARVFAHAAALAGEPRIVVSTRDLDVRVAQLRGPRVVSAPADGGGAALHPRPELRTIYQAPTNPAEEVLVEFWRELTGIADIGVEDDFFQLGGNSLMGMQLISRVREAFAVELPLRAIFEAPTVASLATLIDEAILLELDEMSEEEALALAGGAVA
ncbi:MAG: CerR family C-terminal domain-containing protein, partial [Gemmatimonadetes bacterium]|nr:CerR family C-terminal domain-containing protein [Gemmatimonadota bacterium]